MIYFFAMNLLILFSSLMPSILCYCHCGKYVKRTNGAKSRIYQGTDVMEGRFPWQILMTIEFFSNNQSEYISGAVLISKRHVLTAAHMFYMNQPSSK